MTTAAPGSGPTDGEDRPPLRDVLPRWPVTAADVVAESTDEPRRDPVDPPPAARRPRRPRREKVPAPPSPRPPARSRVARLLAALVATAGLLVSVVLAAGCLAVAVGADTSTGWAEQLASACDALAGWMRGWFDFSGEQGETRETLAAWGAGSVLALVGGRLAAWLLARLA